MKKWIACVLIALVCRATQTWAEDKTGVVPRLTTPALRATPPLQGGEYVSAKIVELIPKSPTPLAARPLVPPQRSSGRGMSKFVWVGLISGFAVSGALIYHYATGPGASVRNCSTCK